MKTRTDRIRAYHACFRGDTYDACGRCGGRCEKHKTCTLVPGEKQYIAASLGVPVSQFERRCLDRLDTPFGSVDVIRLDRACPLLDVDKRCSVIDAKPILCDCYPIVLAPSRGRPRFTVDRRGCPMTRWPAYSSRVEEFVARGVPALARLGLDATWRRMVALYDEFDFDCAAIGRSLERETPHGPVPVEELLAFARGADRVRARSRGLTLLAARLRAAADLELGRLSARGRGRAMPRVEARAYQTAIRRKDRAMRHELAEARRDLGLLSERSATRYLRLVRKTRRTIREIAGDARSFRRRLERHRTIRGSSR